MDETIKEPRILYVEDQTTYGATIAARLSSKLQVRVDTADNGEAAVEKIIEAFKADDSYRVLILDMQVPRSRGEVIDEDFGLQLLVQLRTRYQELLPNCAIIVYTNHACIYRCVECMREGATDFIPKTCPESHADNFERLLHSCQESLEIPIAK